MLVSKMERFDVGIVQKVFSEKASAIARMRQKCVRMGLVLLGKEERSKMRQKCVPKLRQKCFKNARNTFGWKGERDPHPQDFSLSKKTARFTKGQFRPY